MDLALTLPSFVAGTDRATTLEWCRRIDDGPFSSIAVGERTA
ncbi:MAG: LLM class flavin-dependent oxidoreductase, partial [Acidimicrobiia bacterium]|nr:LLM class flavin-dependent oxidoreductase [Acidimicrobiia bacterium]